MKIATATTSFLLALASARAAEELTSETFGAFVKSGKHGMVKFYQSWCGHCMRMKPDWDRLAEEENNDSILIADVNCGDQKEFCDDKNVRGYPTIYYYLNGEENAYEGSRDFDDLSEFVKLTLGKPCSFEKPEDCSERGMKYVAKWKVKSVDDRKKEVKRLEKMVEQSMKSDLKKWVKERIAILSRSDGGEL